MESWNLVDSSTQVAPEPQHIPEAEQEAADPPEVRARHPAVAAAAECADTLADP